MPWCSYSDTYLLHANILGSIVLFYYKQYPKSQSLLSVLEYSEDNGVI